MTRKASGSSRNLTRFGMRRTSFPCAFTEKVVFRFGMRDLYLRALAQSYRYSDEGFAKAVVLARQALAIDPSYAPAAAMVGWCRGLQRLQGWGALSDEDIGEACHLARRALEAERDDAETI